MQKDKNKPKKFKQKKKILIIKTSNKLSLAIKLK